MSERFHDSAIFFAILLPLITAGHALAQSKKFAADNRTVPYGVAYYPD